MTVRLFERQARAIRRCARTHGITHVRVFGSHASGTAKKTSDVDLLVDLKPQRDLLDLIDFKLDVEALLKRKVDVVTPRALSPYVRHHVLQQSRPL